MFLFVKIPYLIVDVLIKLRVHKEGSDDLIAILKFD